jgi:hypothetical protein
MSFPSAEAAATAAAALPDTLTAPDAPAPVVASPDLNILPSVLDDLKRLRSGIGAGAEPIDLAIPGYKGRLVARFRWVPVDELAVTSKSLRAIKDPTQQQIAAAADALVATNDEILVKVDDKLESLQHQGIPVTFVNGDGLTLALGLPKSNSARECVLAVFGNEYALLDLASKVMTWLEDTSRTVDEEHLGE